MLRYSVASELQPEIVSMIVPMTKTFQGSNVTNSCDSGFHLVQRRWWRWANHTASMNSILNSEVACKDLCQQKGFSSDCPQARRTIPAPLLSSFNTPFGSNLWIYRAVKAFPPLGDGTGSIWLSAWWKINWRMKTGWKDVFSPVLPWLIHVIVRLTHGQENLARGDLSVAESLKDQDYYCAGYTEDVCTWPGHCQSEMARSLR